VGGGRASIGFGMLSKYTMAFFVLAIVAGLRLTDVRRCLKSKWLWIGVAVSVLVFLPNLLWQVQHNFVSLDFLKHIHARDLHLGKARSFLPDQLEFTYLPLVIAGPYFYLFSRQGERFRMLGSMYVVTLLLFVIAQGRGYYLFPAYPMLYAAGAVWGEGWLATMQRGQAMKIWRIAWGVLAVGVIGAAAFFLPIAPVNSGWWKVSSALQETYGGGGRNWCRK